MALIIFERVLTHYRLKFYNYLVEHRGEDIIFLTGKIVNKDGFHTQKSSARFKIIEVPKVKLLGFEFYKWPSRLLNKQNVVVCVLSFVSISNLFYLFYARAKGSKFFWWGHTRNFSQDSALEKVKDSIKLGLIRFSNGFLAYTEKEGEHLRQRNAFRESRIICLNNTLDTNYIASIQKEVKQDDILKVNRDLELEGKVVVGLIGRLHALRNTEFAIKAILKINESRENVRLLIIGDGPEYERLLGKYGNKTEIIFVGAIEREKELASYFKNIDFFVNPGLVGLNLVHTMIYQKASIVLEKSIHSPEIGYLIHNENGLISQDNFDSFVYEIEKLINNVSEQLRLGKNAYDYAMEHLTIDNMADKFLEVKRASWK